MSNFEVKHVRHNIEVNTLFIAITGTERNDAIYPLGAPSSSIQQARWSLFLSSTIRKTVKALPACVNLFDAKPMR
jgi:hypothetical protein